MERFLQAQNWLETLSSEAKFFRKGLTPSLEVFNEFLDALKRPDESFEWRVIIGGTAGKGTACRLAEDVLLRAGKRVATLVSPHVQVITERIRINGKLISMEAFGDAILAVKAIAQKLGKRATYYETCVLAGILAAKKAGCEILICEVGLGGEKDAVNAVRGKRIAALTFVGEDHLEILGGNLKKIAETKAGIFTSDSVLNLSFEKNYCSTLEKVAVSKVQFIKGVSSNLGKKIVRKICEKILGSSEFEMRKVQIPARWEVLQTSNKIILDGAHSKPRFEFILPKIKKTTGKKIGVFAIAKSHDPESFKIIEKYFDEIFWTEVSGEREFWPAKMLQQKIGRGVAEKDPVKAFEKAKELGGKILVLGSFYLCGEIRNLFFDPQKIVEQQTEFPS